MPPAMPVPVQNEVEDLDSRMIGLVIQRARTLESSAEAESLGQWVYVK
jgi:hypothetical protein